MPKPPIKSDILTDQERARLRWAQQRVYRWNRATERLVTEKPHLWRLITQQCPAFVHALPEQAEEMVFLFELIEKYLPEE